MSVKSKKNENVCLLDVDGTLVSGSLSVDFYYWGIKKGIFKKDGLKVINKIIRDYRDGIIDYEERGKEIISLLSIEFNNWNIGILRMQVREFLFTYKKTYKNVYKLFDLLNNNKVRIILISRGFEFIIKEWIKVFNFKINSCHGTKLSSFKRGSKYNSLSMVFKKDILKSLINGSNIKHVIGIGDSQQDVEMFLLCDFSIYINSGNLNIREFKNGKIKQVKSLKSAFDILEKFYEKKEN
jgi:phosphoserine phosphatase